MLLFVKSYFQRIEVIRLSENCQNLSFRLKGEIFNLNSFNPLRFLAPIEMTEREYFRTTCFKSEAEASHCMRICQLI